MLNWTHRIIGVLVLIALPCAATELKCAHLPQLFEFFLRHHYLHKTITDTLKTHTVEQFIKTSDPSKTLFLEEDIQWMRKELPNAFATMQAGQCPLLENVHERMLQRAKESEDFARTFLGPKYQFQENSTLILDPKKRNYPKTLDEKKEVLRKMIHFQVSSYLLTDVKLAEAKKLLIHRYELVTKRIRDGKVQDIFTNFTEAFALALDPHSSFLSPDNMEDFKIQMQLSLEGIGASLSSQDGFTVIEALIPGGQAEKTKLLKTKDKIVAVAQEGKGPVNVIDMELREVVKLIRGKKGTKVRLTILRQGKKTETFEVEIVRDKIDIKEQAAKVTYETRKVGNKELKIGVIDLPSFYGSGSPSSRSSSNDLKTLLRQSKEKHVDGIALNLSKNGGGILDEAVTISGFFLKRGSIVSTKDTQTRVQILSDDDDATEYSGPLVVLTSRLSASASEILAGALKDYRRAVIVGGDHTFGKGTVQVLQELPLALGGMKVTTGMFFLPAGKSTQHVGVQAHIALPSVFSTDDIGESSLDYSLPSQEIPPFLSSDANSSFAGLHWQPIEDSTITELNRRSLERVSQDTKFKEILKNIEEARNNKDILNLAEVRKKTLSEKKKKKRNETDTELTKIDETDQAYKDESVQILLDLITRTSPGMHLTEVND